MGTMLCCAVRDVVRRCVAGVRALCDECRLCHPQEALQNRCRWLLSPPCTGGTLSDRNSVLHRERCTNPRRNTSLEQLVLLLSPGRNNLVSWGKE